MDADHELIKRLFESFDGLKEDDIEESCFVASRFDAFMLTEHMLNGNLPAGLRVASGLRRAATPLPLILGALSKELKTTEAFRLAMRSGESETGAFRKLYVWQSRQHTVRAAARRLDTRKFFSAFKLLLLIDRQSKGRASGDPWQSLDALLLELGS